MKKNKEKIIRTSVLIYKDQLDFAKANGIKLSKLVRELLNEVMNKCGQGK